MAKLELECPCGQQQTIRCALDANARHLAELHGWKLLSGQFICPECAKDIVMPPHRSWRQPETK